MDNYFYYPNGNFEKINNFKYISQKTILGLSNNSRVILVNTLAHKSNILLYLPNMSMVSTTGDEFKNIINNKPSSFDIAILYCANYSCNASNNYHKNLNLTKSIEKKIYHYKGGMYEWAMSSCLMPKNFKIFSIQNKKEATIGQIRDIVKNFSHLTNNDKNSNNDVISKSSIIGEMIFSEIFK